MKPIETNETFLRAVESFNRGDYFDAHEDFEELFFEAVRDEVDFVRIFLQASVGAHHVERGQTRAAIQRLNWALKAIERTHDDRGFDLEALALQVRRLIDHVERYGPRGEGTPWPRVERKSPGEGAAGQDEPENRDRR